MSDDLVFEVKNSRCPDCRWWFDGKHDECPDCGSDEIFWVEAFDLGQDHLPQPDEGSDHDH